MSTDSRPSGAVVAWGKPVTLVATLLLLLFATALKGAGSVSLLGISVPAWIVGVGCYLLGAIAVWAATKRVS